jgi:3-carboxy-cis,cis-muconate cycloisomerase
MAALTLDSALYGRLLGDEEIGQILSDAAETGAMIRAEKALALVQTRLGIIPKPDGEALVTALETALIDPSALGEAVRRDGVAVPALVGALREQVPAAAARWLHWGATSQDIADIALVIRVGQILDLVEARLDRLALALGRLALAHRETICLARTRTQAAAPTLFGLRVANWLAPILRHRQRIVEIRPRLFVVQFGGAVGTLAALGERGIDVMDALADELGLARAVPWHKGRDGIVEFGGLLAGIAGSLGMLGADLAALAQSDVGEIALSGAGGSSTMPQKQNPVSAEILVALARFSAGQMASLHQAAIHANERDGAAWTLEWLSLPPLVHAAGAALLHAEGAIAGLTVDPARMRANLEATRGLVLAETASFALSAFMPREEAAGVVKDAAAAAAESGVHLFEAIAARTSAPVDWPGLVDGRATLASATILLDRMLAEAETLVGPLTD